MKQLHILKPKQSNLFFGGSLLVGRRKRLRPLCGRRALHVVMRSNWATKRERFSVNENRTVIKKILNDASKEYGIRIYSFAICSNHIHLLLRAKKRWTYRCFIAVVTGAIAQKIMKGLSFKDFLAIKKKDFGGEGVPTIQKGQAFWEHRPFSRIVNWGREFFRCDKYIERNILEAVGLIKYKPRKDYYAEWKTKFTPG